MTNFLTSIDSNVYNRGGRVLAAIRNDVPAQVLLFPVPGVKHTFIKFSYNNLKCIICGVYFPPNSPPLLYETFTSHLENIVTYNKDYIFIVCEDFDLPGIVWSNDHRGLVYSSMSGVRVLSVLHFLIFFNLIKY